MKKINTKAIWIRKGKETKELNATLTKTKSFGITAMHDDLSNLINKNHIDEGYVAIIYNNEVIKVIKPKGFTGYVEVDNEKVPNYVKKAISDYLTNQANNKNKSESISIISKLVDKII